MNRHFPLDQRLSMFCLVSLTFSISTALEKRAANFQQSYGLVGTRWGQNLGQPQHWQRVLGLFFSCLYEHRHSIFIVTHLMLKSTQHYHLHKNLSGELRSKHGKHRLDTPGICFPDLPGAHVRATAQLLASHHDEVLLALQLAEVDHRKRVAFASVTQSRQPLQALRASMHNEGA